MHLGVTDLHSQEVLVGQIARLTFALLLASDSGQLRLPFVRHSPGSVDRLHLAATDRSCC